MDDVVIQPLTSDLVVDYLEFFDRRAQSAHGLANGSTLNGQQFL